MAGTERRGYGASDAQLFRGRPWVVLPGPASNESSVARVEALTTRVGARPVRLAAERHDELVAAISHLPLLASLALVEAVTGHASWTDARGLAAGGWAGMTRLAAGDPALGAAILGTNAAHVAGWLRRYREILDAWQERLDGLAADTAAANAAHEPIDATDLAALEQKLRALRAQVVEGEGRA
jgi:prephenate dehydrogenase